MGCPLSFNTIQRFSLPPDLLRIHCSRCIWLSNSIRSARELHVDGGFRRCSCYIQLNCLSSSSFCLDTDLQLWLRSSYQIMKGLTPRSFFCGCDVVYYSDLMSPVAEGGWSSWDSDIRCA